MPPGSVTYLGLCQARSFHSALIPLLMSTPSSPSDHRPRLGCRPCALLSLSTQPPDATVFHVAARQAPGPPGFGKRAARRVFRAQEGVWYVFSRPEVLFIFLCHLGPTPTILSPALLIYMLNLASLESHIAIIHSTIPYPPSSVLLHFLLANYYIFRLGLLGMKQPPLVTLSSLRMASSASLSSPSSPYLFLIHTSLAYPRL